MEETIGDKMNRYYELVTEANKLKIEIDAITSSMKIYKLRPLMKIRATENHPTRLKILKLIENGVDIDKLTLRELGNLIGVDHPQKVKHHLEMIDKLKDPDNYISK